ncbi:hypothetical protein FOYG_05878 [Fusarium oxysporum NRRL 32931]|uniref:Uncharacterized protein n=1 Tax=Fusarium oxysporum NRRL 32931 TaxID=660029 RepID=W9IG58_FUSOX|nr:hypothetical protein FOYG_05878 [Fusarium oxysporum NRRL 32931]
MNPLTVWLEIIDPLTGRAIIRETDRLPVISAVSGVAAALATFMKTEYIVGGHLKA